MNSSTESPFRRDEPVGGSAVWVALAACGLAVLVVISTGLWVIAADSVIGFAKLFAAICLQSGLLWLLVRAAGTTIDCRRNRSFDLMARALRAQHRFWIAWTIFVALALLAVIASWWMIRERSENVSEMLEQSRRADARLAPQIHESP